MVVLRLRADIVGTRQDATQDKCAVAVRGSAVLAFSTGFHDHHVARLIAGNVAVDLETLDRALGFAPGLAGRERGRPMNEETGDENRECASFHIARLCHVTSNSMWDRPPGP